MYGLVLHGEDGDKVPVEIEALVVREEDLVRLEDDGVGDDAFGDLDGVEGVVLERVPRVGRHRLVVPVQLVHRRVVLLGDERGRAYDHVLAVLREEAALPVECSGNEGVLVHFTFVTNNSPNSRRKSGVLNAFEGLWFLP